jgi:hypothetical protein
MAFEPEEIERIEDARLVLLGIQPDQLDDMPLQLRAEVLAIHNAHQELKAWAARKKRR